MQNAQAMHQQAINDVTAGMCGSQTGMSTAQNGMIRAQALEAAIRVVGGHGDVEAILSTAKMFEAYLTGK